MNCVVIGAGAWGTALAIHLERRGHAVTLVPRRLEQAEAIASTRENAEYLPGFDLPESIQIGLEYRPVFMEADVVLFSCPAAGMPEAARRVAEGRSSAARRLILLSLAKGFHPEQQRLPSEILAEAMPDLAAGVLSGPTYAAEVAEGKPTAITLAGRGEADWGALQEAFSSECLRVYLGRDLRGVELAGSLKNVYAIATGVSDGLGLGDNARAALLTRALAEMTRIGEAFGGQAATFQGLSGLGDLVATCCGDWSRNRSFGLEVGRGGDPTELIRSSRKAVEGYRSTLGFFNAARQRGVDAPVLAQVYGILYSGNAPREALRSLMARGLKAE